MGYQAPGGHDSWVKPLRDKASAQSINSINDNSGPIELEQVRAAIKSSPKRAGVGSDLWRVRQWESLPEEGLQVLTEILVDMEAQLAYPAQALLNIIALQGKPTG